MLSIFYDTYLIPLLSFDVTVSKLFHRDYGTLTVPFTTRNNVFDSAVDL